MDSALFIILSFACFTWCSFAYQFNVGGKSGWVLNPSENYNHWAGRMRFQVNDTLCELLSYLFSVLFDSVVCLNETLLLYL